jgi:orotate phosphoribosyltransferase
VKEREIIDIFGRSGALLDGHFELSSGLHSRQYLQCALVLQNPAYAEKLCGLLAERFRADGIDVVIGPALGGVVVSYETARALGARSIFSERQKGELRLRRGFKIGKGEKALIVEDVVTTGKSTKEVVEIVKTAGAEIAGVGSIVDRSGGVDFGVRFESLLKMDVKTFKPEACPLCKEGKPVVKPGSRQ